MTSTRAWLEEEVDEILLADGFDAALMGYAQRPGQPPVAVYDRATCIDILMDRDGLSFEEAEEFFEFNVVGAWVGEGTPCFMVRPEMDSLCGND
jgi:hypothetical protein